MKHIIKIMEIKIENYLSDDEIKDIVSDEIRNQVRGLFSNEVKATRLLSNIAYETIEPQVEALIPNHKQKIIDKVVKVIEETELRGYVYSHKWDSNEPDSFGSKLIQQTVKENQELIKDKVIESIKNRDFNEEVWMKFENLAEEFTGNIYDMVQFLKSK